jgi:hypothetical protein
LTRGITDPAGYFYRRAYADSVRAVEFMRTLDHVDPAAIAVTGAGQPIRWGVHRLARHEPVRGDAGAGRPVLEGEVDLVEALGSELVVHFRIDAASWPRARTRRTRSSWSRAARASPACTPARVTGQAIGRGSPSTWT